MARDESKLNEAAPTSAGLETASSPRREHVNLQTASPEEIRADIERTRAEMDRTLDRLTTRVQPRHLLDDVMDLFQRGNDDQDEGSARRTLREAGTMAADKLKSNPMPATLIGAGLAWLLFQDNSKGSHRRTRPAGYDPYTATEYAGVTDESLKENLSSSLSDATDTAGEKAAGLRQNVAAMGSRAQDAAADVRHQTSEGFHAGQQRLKNWAEEAPLAMGIAALAAGLLTGLVLPGTRAEDELMGDASDRLKQQARESGEEVLERGQKAAAAGLDGAKAESQRQNLTVGQVEDKVENIAGRAFDRMRSEFEE